MELPMISSAFAQSAAGGAGGFSLQGLLPFVLIFIIFQIFLGVLTLISGLNIYLASSHQIGSLLLILSVINLHYRQIN